MRELIRRSPILHSGLKPVYAAVVSVPGSVASGTRQLRKLIYKVADRAADERKLMVNVGGGEYLRRHWRVLDFPTPWYSIPSVFVDYPFDLTDGKPFPFADNTVSFFFCSHTLEHIPQEHCARIFAEIHRCLTPGGAVRLTMPDFDLGYSAYGGGDLQFFAKYGGSTIEEKFLYFFATHFSGKASPAEFARRYAEMPKEAFADSYTLQVPRETQRERPGSHINWWNYDKLHRMLSEAGFSIIYRSAPQESRFPEMTGAGRNSGFDSTHPEISIFVEAVKPVGPRSESNRQRPTTNAL